MGYNECGSFGCYSWSKKTAPGAEDAELVILIPVGLPCLERGRLYKKTFLTGVFEHKMIASRET